MTTPAASDINLGQDFTVALWANYGSSPYTDAYLFVNGIAIERKTNGGYNGNSLSVLAGTVGVQDNSGVGIPSGTWIHVIVYHSGNTLGIKVNNTGTSTVDVSGQTLGASSTTYIGYSSSGYSWIGSFDEIGFWNRALTKPEMAALYNGGAGVTLP